MDRFPPDRAAPEPVAGSPTATGERDTLSALPKATGTRLLIERGLAVSLVALLLWGVLQVLLPFATAIAFGSILAIATWPVRRWLVERLRLGPGVAGGVLLLLSLVVVVAPLAVMAPGLGARLGQGYAVLREVMASIPAEPPGWIARLPLVGADVQSWWRDTTANQGNLRALIEPYSERLRDFVVGVAAALADSLLQLLLALIVATMFWINGQGLVAELRAALERIGGESGAKALATAGGAVKGVAYGVIGTCVIQGILMGVGLAMAGVPGSGLLGFVTVVLAISQIGTILVPVIWGGAAWWLWEQGSVTWAVFMLLWGAIAVGSSDNVIRPILIRRGAAIPLTLIILGVFGGFLAFGFLGLFVGPTLLAIGYGLLKDWAAATHAPEQAPAG